MKKKNLLLRLGSLIKLSLLLSFTSCDSGDSSSSNNTQIEVEGVDPTAGEARRVPEFVDPALEVHLNRFLDEMEAREIPFDVTGLTLRFAEQDENIAGICIPSLGQVEVDFFFLFDDTNLEELVFHELGHCILGMEHRDNSIMKEDGAFIGVNAATLDEFFTPELFFEIDVNTSSVPEIRFFEEVEEFE